MRDAARPRPPTRRPAPLLREVCEPGEAAIEACNAGAIATKDAVVFAGLSRSTLFQLARTGRLHPIRVGGKTLWARVELVRLLAQHLDLETS